MKFGITTLLLLVCLAYFDKTTSEADPVPTEMKCQSDSALTGGSGGICVDAGSLVVPAVPENSLLLLQQLRSARDKTAGHHQANEEHAIPPGGANFKTIVYFFQGRGCPHCEEEKQFLDAMKLDNPGLEIREFEVWDNKDNAAKMEAMLRAYGAPSAGVPVTFVHDKVYTGFSAQTGAMISRVINECRMVPCGDPAESAGRANYPVLGAKAGPFTTASSVTSGEAPAETSLTIPLLGTIDVSNASLPLLTLVIAGMDAFNPCAFFVLLSLLGLLLHAHSRDKMLLIGGVFVFFSGFIYFLFMAAWLNLFLIMGHVGIVTTFAGIVSVVIAVINIKDFFLFRQGFSLTISDSAKPKLYERMRRLLRATALIPVLIGTTVLAVFANSYELLCTAGFPMLFTRILTLNNLPAATCYLYLVFYNIIYVVPLFVIVLVFTVTLGRRQLSEWEGRVLKLVSGSMMLGLGAVLFVNPALLNSAMFSFILLVSALGGSLLVAAVTKRFDRD